MNFAKLQRGAFSFIALGIMLATLSCGGGGDNVVTPTVSLSGTWSITETVTSGSGVCADDVGDMRTYTLTVVQSGNNLTATLSGTGTSLDGTVFTGTVSGDQVNWSGSFPEEGGTTTVSDTSITATDTTLSGSADWQWSDGMDSCTGTTSVTGVKS